MKKRIFACLTAVMLLVGLLTACGEDGPLTQEQAHKVALEHAGLSEKDVTDVHTHIVDQQGIPCYSVHITTKTEDLTVVINATTGEVME